MRENDSRPRVYVTMYDITSSAHHDIWFFFYKANKVIYFLVIIIVGRYNSNPKTLSLFWYFLYLIFTIFLDPL